MNDNINLEQNINRLEEIISVLENDEKSLDDSIKLYEEAIAISKKCRAYLDTAEQRIIDITKTN